MTIIPTPFHPLIDVMNCQEGENQKDKKFENFPPCCRHYLEFATEWKNCRREEKFEGKSS